MDLRENVRSPPSPDHETIEIFDGDDLALAPADASPFERPPLAVVEIASTGLWAPLDGPADEIEIFDIDPAPGADVNELIAGARDLHALGDFNGSLRLARQALALDPTHLEARDYLERNEDTLVQMYESKLGLLTRQPRVLLQPDEMAWLNLDHRAGFVLAQIDGQVTLDDVFALSAMSKLDTARILVDLMEQGAIAS